MDDESRKAVLRSSRKRSLSSNRMQSFAEHVSEQLRSDAIAAYPFSKDDSACQPCSKSPRIEDSNYLCSVPSSGRGVQTRSLVLHQSFCHSEIATYQLSKPPRLELEIMRPLSMRGKCWVAFKVADASHAEHYDSRVAEVATRFAIPAPSCSYFNLFNGMWIIPLESDINSADMELNVRCSERALRRLNDSLSRRYVFVCLFKCNPHYRFFWTPRADTSPSRYRTLASVKGEKFVRMFSGHLKIHANVFEIANLLHRNIGFHCLLIKGAKTEESEPFVVDWDLAEEYNASSFFGTSNPLYCVGVKTFVAKEALQFRCRLHIFRYDLESFVWTLVWFLDRFYTWEFRLAKSHLAESQEPIHWHNSTFKDVVQGKKHILNILSGRVRGSEYLREGDAWVKDLKQRVVTILKRIQYDRGRVKRLRQQRHDLIIEYEALDSSQKLETEEAGPDPEKFSLNVNDFQREFLLVTRQLISGDDGFNTDEFLEALHDTPKFPNRVGPLKVSLPRYKLS